MSLRPAGTTGRSPMSSRYNEASMDPTGTARSMRSISAARRSASHTPPVRTPSSTTPSRPRLRSRISWAMRVVARLTSSAVRTRFGSDAPSAASCGARSATSTPPSGPHGTRFTVVGEGSSGGAVASGSSAGADAVGDHDVLLVEDDLVRVAVDQSGEQLALGLADLLAVDDEVLDRGRI